MNTQPRPPAPAAQQQDPPAAPSGSPLRLDLPFRVKLSGVAFPSTAHALIAAPERDGGYRAYVAGSDLNDLKCARQQDDAWPERRSEVHRALLIHHYVRRDMDLLRALVLSGSEDLSGLTAGLPLTPEDRQSLLNELTMLRRELQAFFAVQFGETHPTCGTCRHARQALNASVVACGRSEASPYSLGRPGEEGPLDASPYATGWGRPGRRPEHLQNGTPADGGLIRNDMPLMQLLDGCAAHQPLVH